LLYLADIPPVIQSIYSLNLIINSQVYDRTGCVGGYYYYEALQMNVITSGPYTFSSNSMIHTYGYLYRDHFNPFNVTENLLFENYDGCGYGLFKLAAYLYSNTTYILIVTTLAPNVAGSVEIVASGPTIVAFNLIGEHLHIFLNSVTKSIQNGKRLFLVDKPINPIN